MVTCFRSTSRALLAAFGLALGCNVPEPPPSSGGVDLPEGPCGRGVVVIQSDYASTNVALADLDGVVRSASFLSSGSVTPGLSMPLSGDVVAPSARPASGRIVLIDRYPNAVLTWADPKTALVEAQLSVATGFASNPHDYVEWDDGRAYVSRYESNPAPGREPWDGGGDLLVIRTNPPSVVGRIPLSQPDDGAWLPRPDRMLRIGHHALVLLQRFDAAFSAAGDARIVGVDSTRDQVDWLVALPGAVSCGAIELSPDGSTVVTACSGSFREGQGQLAASALIALDATTLPPREVARFDVAQELGGPIAPTLGFLGDGVVLGVVYGDLVSGTGDEVFRLELSSGRVERLATSGEAFVFGDLRCAPSCGAPCLVADAEGRGLRRWTRSEGGGSLELEPVGMSDTIGLPPRALGGF